MKINWLRNLFSKPQEPKTERVFLNGDPLDIPTDATPKLHPDGVPVGMKPGDPVDPNNFMAIWEFTRRMASGESDNND